MLVHIENLISLPNWYFVVLLKYFTLEYVSSCAKKELGILLRRHMRISVLETLVQEIVRKGHLRSCLPCIEVQDFL